MRVRRHGVPFRPAGRTVHLPETIRIPWITVRKEAALPWKKWLQRLTGRGRWKPLVAVPDSRHELVLSYMTFKDLITSNDEILEVISDLEEKLEGHTYFGMNYIRHRCVTATTHTYRMVSKINELSSRRYEELYLAFDAIKREIEGILDRSRPRRESAGSVILSLAEMDISHAAKVGGKGAHLGEMANVLRLKVPDSFSVSTDAYRLFMRTGGLMERIHALLADLSPERWDDLEGINTASETIRELIRDATLPGVVERALLEAYDRMAGERDEPLAVSVRSSAVGEDGEISFAGQYISILNVKREGLVQAYKDVVAGLFTPRAIFYRAAHGIPDEDIPMGVLCMEMIPAVSSGVACSVDPNAPDTGVMLINGSFGLGVGTVSGSVSPDTWRVSKGNGARTVEALLGSKEIRIDSAHEGGLSESHTQEGSRNDFCLAEEQVLELAEMIERTEAHFARPQEMEWAIDGEGNFYVLQCRPLSLSQMPGNRRTRRPDELEGHPLICTGTPASSGVGCGEAYHLDPDGDFSLFPEGAVLVARRSSPKFVKIMRRASAIVTDVGATAGHMASLAREFGIPAVLGTADASSLIPPGTLVTIDATSGAAYEGRVASLLAVTPRSKIPGLKGTPVYGVLVEVSKKIVPLNLTDPDGPSFHAKGCKTLHDIIRFIHEKTFHEMFHLSDRLTDIRARALRLTARLPFEIHIIDVGGGLRPTASLRRITPEAILSLPMQALLAGMTCKDLRWWEPRGITVSGFLSVATESMMAPRHQVGQRRLGDRSYAILAGSYCNFSSRIGYHYAAVDAFCSETLSQNYISFRFKGGAADDVRRAKRCELIGEILRDLDFHIHKNRDLIHARLRKFPREETLSRLDQVGRLIVATRQLDMRMGPGVSIDWYKKAFFDGNYLFDSKFERADTEP